MSRRRRRKLVKGLGAVLGLCVASTGCQSLPASRTSTPPPAPPPLIGAVEQPAVKEDKPSRFFRWLPAKKSTSRKEPSQTGQWRTATRPGEVTEAAAEAAPVGYPTIGYLPPGEPTIRMTAGVAGIMHSRPAEDKPAKPRTDSGAEKDPQELHPPRLVPLSPSASPSPREVSHTLIGAAAGKHPRELFKQAMPPYRVGPPDVLLVEVLGSKERPADEKTPDLLNKIQPIRGPHLVRPDGTIGLGVFGSVFVAGLTLEEIRHEVADHLTRTRVPVDVREVNADVITYNSQFIYVIADGGLGEPVQAFPFTGGETVLDAMAKIGGVPAVSDKTKIWVARRGPGDHGQILTVDWVGITQRGGSTTNHQLIPGDRIYVKADHWVKFDAELGKRLSPLQQILGATLLGGETVNSLRGNTSR